MLEYSAYNIYLYCVWWPVDEWLPNVTDSIALNSLVISSPSFLSHLRFLHCHGNQIRTPIMVIRTTLAWNHQRSFALTQRCQRRVFYHYTDQERTSKGYSFDCWRAFTTEVVWCVSITITMANVLCFPIILIDEVLVIMITYAYLWSLGYLVTIIRIFESDFGCRVEIPCEEDRLPIICKLHNKPPSLAPS